MSNHSGSPMTSVVKQPDNGGHSDGNGLILVIEEDVHAQNTPLVVKLTPLTVNHPDLTVTKPAISASPWLVVLCRKAFDSDSLLKLRIRRPAFAFQLNMLQAALERELGPNDGRRKVLSIQCLTPGYITDMSTAHHVGDASNEVQRRHHDAIDVPEQLYARGFIVVLPSDETFQTQRTRIQDIVDECGFEVVLERIDLTNTCQLLSRDSGAGVKLVSWLSSQLDVGVAPVTLQVDELSGPELEAYERQPPAFKEPTNNTVFHRLADVGDIFTEAKASTHQACIDELLNCLKSVEVPDNTATPKHPFIVVEGLDATGKSTIVSNLVRRLDACQLYSPPPSIQNMRSAFDDMPAVLRRAYYSLGNYLVGQTASQMTSQKAVVLDRYWHSTAAYAMAEESSIPQDENHWIYKWPQNLFKPTVVILLVVSEEQRMQRLQSRSETLGAAPCTREERLLAADDHKRDRILDAYRKMKDPGVIEVSAEGSSEKVLDRVLQTLYSRGVLQ